MVFIPNVSKNGACDRGRTCDINLGRVALYQLSYARINYGGERWVRTIEGNANRFTVCPL